ncbi:protein SPA2 [Dichotomopilus funicola]|uniref:Protein SPA2 n=1 Tax=Dichotomopilus funicola TaxID=1934379 RepID=A0AAN6UZG6_9PEZI|nr:protein SPA2 [Dichotomopilus funicola]
MNGPDTPSSPISVGASEWSYPAADSRPQYPNNNNNQGQLNTPPDSAGPVTPMNNNFPPGPRSVGGPSPPPSVGRSSAGTNIYARSESGRSQSQSQSENAEFVLSEHYVSLKRFLSATSRDGNPRPQPNKARDKLQRLTSVQFLELSTDVYDELRRREAASRRPPNAPPGVGAPAYLLPENTFHPKRNQARQKLSSLGSARFRDLAMDIFCELERRFPRFMGNDVPRVGSPMSARGGPPSRSGTPVNGMNGYPPRGQSRRRPSEASSVRSGRGLPPGPMQGFPMPPSPSLANGEYGRPMPKQFQSNTIVPNKSTMVEEDDDAISPTSPDPNGGYGMQRSLDERVGPSESDKRAIEEYEVQVKDLQEKLASTEESLKKKEEELEDERSRAAAAESAKEEWEDARASLENKLAEAQELNDSLQREIERVRGEHLNETRELRNEIEQVQSNGLGNADPELERENKALRTALEEQEQVTEEVRREAQEFLREMKSISQQSGATWEKHSQMEKTIESLEHDVREWQNRYARAKTQLRDMRGSSAGLTIDQDASKPLREKGFVEDNGLVKDIHVTKFQLAIDELLRRARDDHPDRVTDAMKSVVVSVRRITKDLDGAGQGQNGETAVQFQKPKSRVSSTANALITASKNFASSAGISPVSVLDAAASHLVAAVVELLRAAKIRTTPEDELEEEDEGTITPVDSSGFFSPQSNGQSQISSIASIQEALPPPPPFQGLGPRSHVSVDSSSYSPVSSPRESFAKGALARNGPIAEGNGGYGGLDKALPIAPNGNLNGGGNPYANNNRRTEDLKLYLEDQTAVLVQTIQALVQLVRDDPAIGRVTEEINVITEVVGQVADETKAAAPGGSGAAMVQRLETCRERLMEAGHRGVDIAATAGSGDDREWRMWTQTLPPIAFEIARETKELVQRVDQLVLDG